MKTYLSPIFLSLFLLTTPCLPGHAQEEKPKEPATKLEAFLAKTGTLFVKDFYNLGKIRGLGTIELKALVTYQPGQETLTIHGLTIEVTEAGRLEFSGTSFLDLEEIESLSKAIAYMLDLSEKWKDTDKEYTEVIFLTKGYFKAGFYQKGTKQQAFASSGYIAGRTCGLSMNDLASLKALVDQGAALLATK